VNFDEIRLVASHHLFTLFQNYLFIKNLGFNHVSRLLLTHALFILSPVVISVVVLACCQRTDLYTYSERETMFNRRVQHPHTPH